MRIELPYETERFGALLIHNVQKVYELDSGLRAYVGAQEEGSVINSIPYEDLYEKLKEMVIVVPVRGERVKLVQGVMVGIPNQCLTIVASNSPREPVDRFAIEREALSNFSRYTRKRTSVVHQKDPAVAQACLDAGYDALLDENTGLVRGGKAEGMILATLLARLSGRKYIGFIDSDNFFPGAVLEYIHEYAAAFTMSRSPLSMVRISWHSKPKVIQDSLFFAKWGRTSRTTNRFLNRLIAEYTGFETEIVKTGNAGEHALSLDLAMQLKYSSGYSIEPYHYINMFEQYGGLAGSTLSKHMVQQHVEVFQIESRNPHMHDTQKGEEHISEMTYAALQVIAASEICPDNLRRRAEREIERLELSEAQKRALQVRYYPALNSADLDKFAAAIEERPFARHLLSDT